MGIRDIAEVEQISVGKVLHLLANLKVSPRPKQSHYGELEIDEFWGYVGKKSLTKFGSFMLIIAAVERLWLGFLENVIVRQPKRYAKKSKH